MDNIISKAKQAKRAALILATISSAEKNKALKAMAQALLDKSAYIILENKKDIIAAQKANYAKALIDRLTLNDKRIKEMAECLTDTTKLPDLIGETMATYKRPNGLVIKKVRCPIGVVGIIYESRPNVTSDCIGLCLKSGNSVILKGGKEAVNSNQAIFKVLKAVLKNTKVPSECVQMIDSTDRQSMTEMLGLTEYVDLIVPRGGEALIRFVGENSRIPVIKHYKGVCHTYVSNKANLKMAEEICFNAKVQRPGVCNAMETMLVHKQIAKKFLPVMIERFQKAGVEIRGCVRTRAIVKNIKAAKESDWPTEYLDLILAVKVVDSVEDAIEHINTYGSRHSDTIVTESKTEAEKFFASVDSACLYQNASTRFTDGYQFGFGAEVGISTDKIHVRGPMGIEGLTSYKYIIYGKGQVRS
ncbi:MAG: glutamate-5-semialdehyde dehydrogenase [Candidatus Omnitrophica bacterium]|nr:glutamate-5-semialdehyde dehydrogenase [Candidatus Omnitrophota bacterium]